MAMAAREAMLSLEMTKGDLLSTADLFPSGGSASESAEIVTEEEIMPLSDVGPFGGDAVGTCRSVTVRRRPRSKSTLSDDDQGSSTQEAGEPPASGGCCIRQPAQDQCSCSHTEESTSGPDLGTDSEGHGSGGIVHHTVPRKRGTNKGGYVRQPGDVQNRHVSPEAVARLSDDTWSATTVRVEGQQPLVNLMEVRTGTEFMVPFRRAAKAKVQLDWDTCLAPLKKAACKCHRQCFKAILDPAWIQQIRAQLCSRSGSECDLAATVRDMLEASGVGKFTVPLRNGGGRVRCCRRYFATVYGIGERRAQQLLKNAKDGSRRAAKQVRGKKHPRRTSVNRTRKDTVAYAFWYLFFEQNCQRPNDEIRLFPVDMTQAAIYKDFFEPWFARQVKRGNYAEADKPVQSYWWKGKKHPDFADVKKKKKHTHGRCKTCAELGKMLLKAFKDGRAEEEYVQKRRLHNQEVDRWNKMEETLKAMSKSSPSELQLILHDGTLSMGYPRLGRRGIKNMDPTRFDVTPWLGIDYSGGKSDYVYTPADATRKDRNYLITLLDPRDGEKSKERLYRRRKEVPSKEAGGDCGQCLGEQEQHAVWVRDGSGGGRVVRRSPISLRACGPYTQRS